MMISRDILEAQLGLYQQGQARAMDELEKAKANAAAAAGAIESIQNLLRVLTQLEKVEAGAPDTSGMVRFDQGDTIPEEGAIPTKETEDND